MLQSFDDINPNSKNPAFEEYILFKKENPDSIIFFQIGSFYETFFEDAKVFSEITGATLSSRNIKGFGEVIQAGFSKVSLDIYLKKLLTQGLKVCVCAEFKDDDNIFHRKVVRKYTKGTLIENEFLEASENNFIAVLYFKDNIAYFSYADVSEGQFYKTSDKLDEVIFEVEKISPSELLICDKQKDLFKNLISKFNVTMLDSSYFNCENIENTILKYCAETQKSYLVEFDKITEYKINSYLLMDDITRKSLELTRTRRYLKKKGSIFWFLNYTKTPMGCRLLKKYLSEPLLDIKKINQRLEATKELKDNPLVLEKIENLLKNFCDLSRICARISNSTIYPKDLLKISKDTLLLKELVVIMDKLKSKYLKIDKKKLLEIIDFSSILKKAIREDAPNATKEGGIINEGYNSELDYLRYELSKFINELEKYQESQRGHLGISKLKIEYSGTLGYYIEIPVSYKNSIGQGYYRKQELKNVVRYSTDELNELQKNIFSRRYKINSIEYELYCDLRKKANEFVENIRLLAKELASIDVISSFARAAIENNLACPILGGRDIIIKDGFHPSLLKLNNEIIKNDTELKDGSMIILTGANMSGKSTYLKYNAIISLLAQIGSFVPAKSAHLSVIDKLFFRQGSNDDIINNNSSFMVEMNDLKFIIDNIGDNSLVLLDEPAKSTNAKEGGAIAKAFLEYMLNHNNAKIILATHNNQLTQLENIFPNRAFNYVIGGNNQINGTTIDRKIKRGVVSSSLAINTAILANLPSEIIEKTKEYLKN